MSTFTLTHSTTIDTHCMSGPGPMQARLCAHSCWVIHTQTTVCAHPSWAVSCTHSQGPEGDHTPVCAQPGSPWHSHTHLDWLYPHSRAPCSPASALWSTPAPSDRGGFWVPGDRYQRPSAEARATPGRLAVEGWGMGWIRAHLCLPAQPAPLACE